MQHYIIKEYQTAEGKSPFGEWAAKLPRQHFEKVQDAIRRMEMGNPGEVKSVGGGVYERKLKNPALRIYFARDGERIILLLTGGGKQRQSKDIERAREHWADYKARKKRNQ